MSGLEFPQFCYESYSMKDYRQDDQARKDRKALLRALRPFGYAALAGISFGALLALLALL